MFTDVAGYTAMSSRDEETALGLLKKYRQTLESVFPSYSGRVVKTMGDGFLVEFVSAVEAVDCAVEAQDRIGRLNSTLKQEEKILVRIGVHVGDIVHEGEDVLGDAVNVASRVEPLAEPGGVCVTRQVVDQVEGKVKWHIVSMGQRQLKNVPHPVEVFRVEGRGERVGLQPTSEPDRRRVAILPFANLSPDPNDRYFADGMTEELISTVSKIGGLSVISRASAMKYRDTALPIGQVGQQLGVGAILEGSVRKAGNRVRIAAQLIEVDTDSYVWSQSYDRDVVDVFGVQGEIAQQVAEGLKVQLLRKDREKLEARPTEDPVAYNLYLKGRYYWNERSEEGTRKALRYFEEASKADHRFAKAYTGIADCYLILSDYGWMPPAEGGALAKENVMKALEVDESLAEAHASLGLVLMNHDWDFDGSERELRTAMELNPSYVPAYHWYGVMLNFQRRYEEARQMILRALQLDPFSMVVRQSLGVTLLCLGRYEEALGKFDELDKENPNLPSVHYWMSKAHLGLGAYPQALAESEEEVRADNKSEGSKLDMAYVMSEAGLKTEAGRILDEVLVKKDVYYSPCSVGAAMLSLGRDEDGKVWMRKALESRDSSLLYFRSLPTYSKYSKSPWWEEIEQQMKLAGGTGSPKLRP